MQNHNTNPEARELTIDEVQLISGGFGSEIFATGGTYRSGPPAWTGSSSSGSGGSGGGGNQSAEETQEDAETLQDLGGAMMAAGVVITAADGPLPVADVVGVPLAAAGGVVYLFGLAIEYVTNNY